MANPEIILEVTNKKVGRSWLYNYPSYKLFGDPRQNPNWGQLGYQPDKLDTKLYLVPTYQMNLYVKCPGKEKRQVGAFEVVRFARRGQVLKSRFSPFGSPRNHIDDGTVLFQDLTLTPPRNFRRDGAR